MYQCMRLDISNVHYLTIKRKHLDENSTINAHFFCDTGTSALIF